MLKKWLISAALTVGLALPASAQMNIRVGFPDPMTTSWAQGLSEFKRIVEAESNGRMKVSLYPSEQLGSLVEMIGSVKSGVQEISLGSPAVFSQFSNKIDMLEMPFLINDWKQASKMTSSQAYQDLLKVAEKESGVRVYATFPFGFRNIINKKQPINTLEDLKGMKIRVINSPLQLAVWRALGASPVGMGWSEVYLAVQSGVLDGLENTPGVLAASKFPEVAKYITESRHMFGIMLAYINPKFHDSLKPEDRAILDKAMKAAEEFNQKNVIALEEKAANDLKGMGAVVNQMSPATLKSMQTAVEPVYQSLASRYEPHISALRKAINE